MGQVFGGYASAGIRYTDTDGISGLFTGKRNGSAFTGISDGVCDKKKICLSGC
jgi:hypothetical protein